MRDSFVFYRSFAEGIKCLNEDDQLRALWDIINYALNETEPNENGVAEAVFNMAKPQIDKNNIRYQNGIKGGRPKNQTKTELKPKQNQNITKPKPNDNVNDNVNDNDINNISCLEPLISLVLNTGDEYPFYQKDIDGFAALYPAVDIMQEMRKMKGWCENNPANRKTSRGIRRFVNSWLAKEQDRAKKPQQPTAKPNSFNNFSQRDQDYEAIQAALIKKSMNGDQ